MLREIRASELPSYQKKNFTIKNRSFRDGKKIEIFTKNYNSFGSKTGLFFNSLIKTLILVPLFIKNKREALFDQWRAIKSGEISVKVVTDSNREAPKTELFKSRVTKKATLTVKEKSKEASRREDETAKGKQISAKKKETTEVDTTTKVKETQLPKGPVEEIEGIPVTMVEALGGKENFLKVPELKNWNKDYYSKSINAPVMRGVIDGEPFILFSYDYEVNKATKHGRECLRWAKNTQSWQRASFSDSQLSLDLNKNPDIKANSKAETFMLDRIKRLVNGGYVGILDNYSDKTGRPIFSLPKISDLDSLRPKDAYLKGQDLEDYMELDTVVYEKAPTEEDYTDISLTEFQPEESKKPIKKSPSILERRPLLQMGQIREGTGEGQPVSRMGKMFFRDGMTIISNKKIITAGFASCFHTTESHKEIFDLIYGIREKNDPSRQFFNPSGEKIAYTDSIYTKFRNNLAHLHQALPGKPHEKSAKIYWSDEVENELFPLFFFNEKCFIDDLVFAIIPGDEIRSDFQAEKTDFSRQLQFIGVGQEKILTELDNEISSLSEQVLGENILNDLLAKIGDEENPLMLRAATYTFLYKGLERLKNMAPELEKLPIEERKNAFLAKI